MSVIDVIVIAIPLVRIVLPIRVSTSWSLFVSAKPDRRMNILSTPIPVRRKTVLTLSWFRMIKNMKERRLKGNDKNITLFSLDASYYNCQLT